MRYINHIIIINHYQTCPFICIKWYAVQKKLLILAMFNLTMKSKINFEFEVLTHMLLYSLLESNQAHAQIGYFGFGLGQLIWLCFTSSPGCQGNLLTIKDLSLASMSLMMPGPEQMIWPNFK